MNKKTILNGSFFVFLISIIPGILSFFMNNSFLLVFRWIFFISFSLIVFIVFDKLYYKSSLDTQNEINNKIKYVFLLFLFLLALSSLNFKFMKPVTNFLLPLQMRITIFIIVFGFLTFYLNRDVIGDVKKEKNREEQDEEKRKNNFAKIHQRMNSIPILKHLLKWMYKEGWWYSVLFLLFILIGLGLRIYHLNYLNPITDEMSHLVAAKRFMVYGTFNYHRASFLTYIIGLLFKFNKGTSIFLGRLPSVVFGVLSIFVIYFLGKKINKKVGIFSCYLLAFSPLAIGMSRYIREYQAYFFFILLFLLVFVHFFNKPISLLSWGKKILIIILLSLFFVFPAFYYVFIERVAGIFELYFILFVYFFVFLIKSTQFKSLITNKKFYFLAFSLFFILLLIIPNFLTHYQWLLKNKNFIHKEELYEDMMFNPEWEYRNGDLNLQWFSDTNINKLFAISFFLLSFFFFYRNRLFISSFLSFSAIYLFFLFLVNHYFAPRYLYYPFIFYIIVYSCSAFILFSSQKLFFKKTKLIYLFIFSILLLSFFSPITAINGLAMEKNGHLDSKTEFIHRQIQPLFEFLNNNSFDEKDVLITANPTLFIYYFNYTFIKNASKWPLKRFDYEKGIFGKLTNRFVYDYGGLYHYYYSVRYLHKCKDGLCDLDEMERMKKIISTHSMGWIVIDKDRNRHWNKGFPIMNFNVSDKMVHYLDSTSGYRGFDIYKWSPKSVYNSTKFNNST